MSKQIIRALLEGVLETLEANPALAARLGAALGGATKTDAKQEWIPLREVSIARKTARRLARTGQVEAKQVEGRWYVRRASLEAYMTSAAPANDEANDDESALRAELGLAHAGGRR